MKYSIFDSLLEAVFAINKDQKIVYCNETAGVLLDNSVRKLMKMTLPEAITFIPNSPEFYKNLANITDPSPYEELNFETSTGKAGKLQVTVQPDTESDPQNPCWLVFFRDVTLEETLQKKYRSQLEQKEEVILDLQKARAQLEEYSKNLEKMVEERTAEIRQLNRWMSALLDSLGQGFFIFDKDCKILPVTSKACESTLETDPKGKFVYDIFKIKPEKVDGFKKWVMTVFGEMLPFQDLAPLGPDRYQHSKDREISIQYHPIRTPEGKIDGVVVVSTDITDLVQAQKEAERDRNYAKMIVNLVKNKKMAQSFVRESQNILAELKTYIQRPNPDT
ncbi:MAG: PAS domain-containing protein, partial [Pseudobdellovibrionaceae bacterium]